jgi:hypothetical protein
MTMHRVLFIRARWLTLVAAILMAALATACGGNLSDSERQAPAAPAETGDEPGTSDAAVGAGDGEGSLPLPQLDRKIIRTARLELDVEDVSAAVTEVEDVAEAAGGWVSASSVFVDRASDDESPRRTETATVTIRVPADAYRSVVSQLRSLAEEVKSETSEASEVTEEYTDLQARLRNQEATEAELLKLLERAETIPDILTVQEKVDQVRLEIERLQGRINVLDSLTSMATITVELAVPTPAAPGDDQGWAADAWNVAWEGSQVTVVVLGSMAIVGGMVLAWLAIPLFVVAVVWWRFGKRLSRVLRQLSGQAPGGSGT